MLSKKDWLILEKLSEDSRKSIKDLARETRLPRTTVFDRIKKMKTRGVIKAFTLQPDFEKIGLETTAFLLVKFTPVKKVEQRAVAKEIAKLKGVYEVHLVTGEWDMIVKARAKGLKELGELVLDKIRQIEGVSQTVTSAVLQTVKEKTFD